MGLRNETAIRLASYLANFRGEGPESVWRHLLKWNKLNKTPLEIRELRSVFESALKNKYVYGCNDDLLSRLCSGKADCPLAGDVSPIKLIEEEFKRREAVQLHPLIDYHPKVGFCLGALLGANSKSLIFLAEKPFISDFNPFQIQAESTMSITVRRLRWAKLQQDWAYKLLQASREHFENGEVKFPSKREVFEKLLGRLSHYWWHSDSRVYLLVTCWVIATYMHRLFTFFPALNPQGERETGKTTLLEVIGCCAWNPTGRETAVREADLFRTIEGTRGTYLMDITLLDKSKDTRDIIDVIETGTEVGGKVRRINKETGKPEEFETYGPKAIATRYELPFVAKCIRVITEKTPDLAYAKRRAFLPFDHEWSNIRGLLIRAAVKYWREVKDAYESLEQTDKLCGRTFNYWAPILAVCKVFAPEKFGELLNYAEEEAQKAEKGDRLSEVETGVLAALMDETEEERQTATVFLKELTDNVQTIIPWVKDWHIVKSALENLSIVKRKYETSKGVQFQIDMERVKTKASERKIQTVENAITEPNSGESKQEEPSSPEEASINESEKAQVDFSWRQIQPAERCELCGKFAVEYEVNDAKGRQILRRCQSCFERMRQTFRDAVWKNVGG